LQHWGYLSGSYFLPPPSTHPIVHPSPALPKPHYPITPFSPINHGTHWIHWKGFCLKKGSGTATAFLGNFLKILKHLIT
jgi:hypothetical protein